MMLPWAGLYELAARGRGLICRGLIFRFSSIFVSVENRAPSRSRKLGMTFANFLDLGVPHSQPKRKLINISGERGHFRRSQVAAASQVDKITSSRSITSSTAEKGEEVP